MGLLYDPGKPDGVDRMAPKTQTIACSFATGDFKSFDGYATADDRNTTQAIPYQSIDSSNNYPQDRLASIIRHMAPVTASMFSADRVPLAPEDPLFGLMAAYKKDGFERKVDLGIGAYRDNDAKPWVLPVVKQADELLRQDPTLNHEYLPIAGLATFTSAAARLMLGADSPAIKERRVCS